jgi:hypothetical protein
MMFQELNMPLELRVAQWVHQFYLNNRRVPTVNDVWESWRDELDNVLSVARIFEDPDFRHYVLSRGVPWIRVDKKGRPTRLSAEQLYVISHVMDPTIRGGLRNKLLKLGIRYSTWSTWMKNPEFKMTVERMSEDALSEHMPLIQTALIETAEKGDMNAIKFAYEITGRYDPANKSVVDVMAVLSRVVEIITKHVDDPLTLAKIGSEVQMLANSALGNGAGTKVISATPVAAFDTGDSVFSFKDDYGNPDQQIKVIQARD